MKITWIFLILAIVCALFSDKIDAAFKADQKLKRIILIFSGGILLAVSYTHLWFALPLTLVSGGDAAECLTIALAFAAVQNILNTVGNLVKVGFLHRQDALIEKGKIKQAWWFPACGHIWTFVSCMIIVPVFCLAGSAVISNIVNALPPQINAITSTFTGLLPAIGFMILMVTLIHTPFQWIYFLFGFVLAAALGWDTISITIMGCVIAYLIFQFTPGKQLAGAAVEEDDD